MVGLSWSTPIIAAAAVVQAAAAALIWRLTRKLVGATTAYVDKTDELVAEMKRTNDMAQQSTDRALQTQAPVLEWSDGDLNHPEGHEWSFGYAVWNTGISPA